MDRDWCLRHKQAYLLLGDDDKGFHRPECECERCEQWRRDHGRPTHAELRGVSGRAGPGR